MRSKTFLLLVLFLCQVPQGLAAAERLSSASAYTLATGDLVSIQVYGEADLSLETRLSDAGTIIYPFLGELKLAGMTIGEAERTITRGLKGDYLVDPKVSVRVAEYRQFYVDGQVKKPGGYPYQPGLTVQRAVSLAGGFTERASRSSIYIVKEGRQKDQQRRAGLNSTVGPGDIVIVEESFF
jgi:polysaccharide export outer membrane protein